jgi:hypothetical protein
MVMMLQVRETGGNTAFPSQGAIGRMANIASRSTIARAIAILRATRWLTLCRRVRTPSGRFCGNVYALHDEPMPLAAWVKAAPLFSLGSIPPVYNGLQL